ncbi:nitroreductase [Pseudonocardia halophobica]|uniref:Nitroreductase n=1 Tax=Pseudonocardia halophobica TaxID=29401 RepID=A0A9W6UFY5_9PSEU|nr:nitroreductase [Pseudonocardia halophobica]GLL15833.1 nitroreductase [Pseudonocardia halophobica]
MNATVGAGTLGALLADRHSCRAFRPDPVPTAVLDDIVAQATRAPSWCNTQPWQVAILSGAPLEAFRAELLAAERSRPDEAEFEAGPPRYVGASLQRRREAGWALYSAVGARRGDRAATSTQALENFRFFGAPHVAVLSADAHLGAYGLVDCGSFVSLLLLAAQARGVATIAQAAIVSRPDIVRRHVPLGSDRTLVCGISLGFAVRGHPANAFRTDRAPLEDVRVHIGAPTPTVEDHP